METKSKVAKVFFYVFCSFVGLVFMFPIYYTFINSLRDVYSTPATLLPKGFEWINFKYALTLIPFFKYLGNSLIILAISVPLGVLMNFLFGYALAKYKAPGSKVLFFLVLSTMMIPTFATQIPQYIMFTKIGITNTFLIWVFEALAGSSYQIFLCRQYLSGIPSSIIEAATVDGCSQSQIIFRVVMPNSKSLLAIVMFNLINFHWGDYMTPYMYLSREKYPLIMALFNNYEYVFPGSGFKLVPVVNAATLFVMIPIFIVFFLCQKQLIQGTATSGIKG